MSVIWTVVCSNEDTTLSILFRLGHLRATWINILTFDSRAKRLMINKPITLNVSTEKDFRLWWNISEHMSYKSGFSISLLYLLLGSTCKSTRYLYVHDVLLWRYEVWRSTLMFSPFRGNEIQTPELKRTTGATNVDLFQR